jgi:hypothetical protein
MIRQIVADFVGIIKLGSAESGYQVQQRRIARFNKPSACLSFSSATSPYPPRSSSSASRSPSLSASAQLDRPPATKHSKNCFRLLVVQLSQLHYSDHPPH